MLKEPSLMRTLIRRRGDTADPRPDPGDVFRAFRENLERRAVRRGDRSGSARVGSGERETRR